MPTSGTLELAPLAIEFPAFEHNTPYVATFHVRNTSARVVRFRLQPPALVSFFKVFRRGQDLARHENASVTLSPGLSLDYDVIFEETGPLDHESVSTRSKSLHDVVHIRQDDGTSLELPLIARRAGPVVHVTPVVCAFGFVALTQRSAQFLNVKNSGTKAGTFSIDVMHSRDETRVSMTIFPKRGELRPGEGVKVQVEALGVEMGAFRALLRVSMRESYDSGASCETLVDISGLVVEQTVDLVSSIGRERVESLSFGSIFAGERRTIETVLRNNGPYSLSFMTLIRLSNEEMSENSEYERETSREMNKRRQEVQLIPSNGTVAPFSEMLVTFLYHPPAKTVEEMTQLARTQAKTDQTLDCSSLHAFISITCETFELQTLRIELSGQAFAPLVDISPTLPLDFGLTCSYARIDMLLSLRNVSRLPIHFQVTNTVAHFSITPRKGHLNVSQSLSLIVTFTPKQLGTFKSIFRLEIQNGLSVIPLPVRGRAVVGSPEPRALALLSDYNFRLPDEAKDSKAQVTRQFQRLNVYELAALNDTAFVDEFESQGRENATQLTYCVKELARRAAHRAAYHEYLAQCRAQRERGHGKAQKLKKKIAQAREVTPNVDLDLGMERLHPKDLKLVGSKNESVSLSKDARGESRQARFNELKRVTKKFKATPSTAVEIAECSRILTFEELEEIVSGPQVLNFGRLSVNGTATRSLTIQNPLSQHLLVTLHFEKRDSSRKEGELAPSFDVLRRQTLVTSQVVPPKAKAGFDLVFCSSCEQVFHHSIAYSLNNVHFRSVTIIAEVTPIIVEIAPPELQFDAQVLHDLSQKLCQPVVLTNTCDSEASFCWKHLPLSVTPEDSTCVTALDPPPTIKMAPIFEILPASGVLKSLETLECKVLYTPPPLTKSLKTLCGLSNDCKAFQLAQLMDLEVSGGIKGKGLRCQALVRKVKVLMREKKVDFGTISVGMEWEKRVTWTNVSTETSAVFATTIEPHSVSKMFKLHVTPSQGVVRPLESIDLVVKGFSHRALTFDGKTNQVDVHVAIRGGKRFHLPVHVTVIVPHVVLSPLEAITFQQVVVGASASRTISFDNRSAITASLILDFSFSNEFTLAPFNDVANLFTPLNSDESTLTQRWRIDLPPSTIVSCPLVFTPLEEGTSEFLVPFHFAGVSSACMPLTRRIVAHAIAPILGFSTSTIQFPHCVVSRERHVLPSTQHLVLSNDHVEAICWQLDPQRLRQGHFLTLVFHIAPDHGELAPGEHVTLYINFLPRETIEYVENELPLLVNEKEYVNLSLQGEGIEPHLSFSTNRVLLPTVPLGITARAQFQVYATGYDKLELSYRFLLNHSQVPLSIHFPRGKTLSKACLSVPVEISFTSSFSLAFTTKVEFSDEQGKVFALTLAGCTDNCLLTNSWFLETCGLATEANSTPKYTFYTHKSGHFPVYLLSTKQAQKELEKHQNLTLDDVPVNGFVTLEGDNKSTSSGQVESLSEPPFSQGEIHFVLHYLNATFLDTPVVHFPEDFANSFGRPLYHLLDKVYITKPGEKRFPNFGRTARGNRRKNAEALNRMQPPNSNMDDGSYKSVTKTQLNEYVTRFCKLFQFLRAHGAMLHDVYPEQLLPQDLYVRVLESSEGDVALYSSLSYATLQSSQKRRLLLTEWQSVSSTAWIKVIYQVLKCFLLSRITYKAYQLQVQKLNPAQDIKGTMTERACQGSNVYSEAEMVLLQWLCDHLSSRKSIYSFNDLLPLELHLLDLGRELRDGFWLFHLVAAHVPPLSLDFDAFSVRNPLSKAQSDQQTTLLLQLLRHFGLDFAFEDSRFLRHYTGREILLLLTHLYHTLPHFVPKATLEFRGHVGQVLDKCIQLTNSSPRALRYRVFLDHKAEEERLSEYTLEAKEIVLAPGSNLAFTVTFRPRFSRKTARRLVFQAVKSEISDGTGATMVFLLESDIVSQNPVRIIELETKTYEKHSQDLVIENPFPANGKFNVVLTQEHETNTLRAVKKIVENKDKKHRKKAEGSKTGKNGPNVDQSFDFTDTKRELGQIPAPNEAFANCLRALQAFYLPDVASLKKGLSIRENGSIKVKLDFLPLAPGTYRCDLLFVDETLGEFVYQVQAVATLPSSLETLEMEWDAGMESTGSLQVPFVRELTIPVPNVLLQRALARYLERTVGEHRTKLRDGLKQCQENHHSSFHIDLNSPYVTTKTPEVTLSTGKDRSAVSNIHSTGVRARVGPPRSASTGFNSILIEFQPQSPASYTCQLVLQSQNTVCQSTDVRVYDLSVTKNRNR